MLPDTTGYSVQQENPTNEKGEKKSGQEQTVDEAKALFLDYGNGGVVIDVLDSIGKLYGFEEPDEELDAALFIDALLSDGDYILKNGPRHIEMSQADFLNNLSTLGSNYVYAINYETCQSKEKSCMNTSVAGDYVHFVISMLQQHLPQCLSSVTNNSDIPFMMKVLSSRPPSNFSAKPSLDLIKILSKYSDSRFREMYANASDEFIKNEMEMLKAIIDHEMKVFDLATSSMGGTGLTLKQHLDFRSQISDDVLSGIFKIGLDICIRAWFRTVNESRSYILMLKNVESLWSDTNVAFQSTLKADDELHIRRKLLAIIRNLVDKLTLGEEDAKHLIDHDTLGKYIIKLQSFKEEVTAQEHIATIGGNKTNLTFPILGIPKAYEFEYVSALLKDSFVEYNHAKNILNSFLPETLDIDESIKGEVCSLRSMADKILKGIQATYNFDSAAADLRSRLGDDAYNVDFNSLDSKASEIIKRELNEHLHYIKVALKRLDGLYIEYYRILHRIKALYSPFKNIYCTKYTFSRLIDVILHASSVASRHYETYENAIKSYANSDKTFREFETLYKSGEKIEVDSLYDNVVLRRDEITNVLKIWYVERHRVERLNIMATTVDKSLYEIEEYGHPDNNNSHWAVRLQNLFYDNIKYVQDIILLEHSIKRIVLMSKEYTEAVDSLIRMNTDTVETRDVASPSHIQGEKESVNVWDVNSSPPPWFRSNDHLSTRLKDYFEQFQPRCHQMKSTLNVYRKLLYGKTDQVPEERAARLFANAVDIYNGLIKSVERADTIYDSIVNFNLLYKLNVSGRLSEQQILNGNKSMKALLDDVPSEEEVLQIIEPTVFESKEREFFETLKEIDGLSKSSEGFSKLSNPAYARTREHSRRRRRKQSDNSEASATNEQEGTGVESASYATSDSRQFRNSGIAVSAVNVRSVTFLLMTVSCFCQVVF